MFFGRVLKDNDWAHGLKWAVLWETLPGQNLLPLCTDWT